MPQFVPGPLTGFPHILKINTAETDSRVKGMKSKAAAFLLCWSGRSQAAWKDGFARCSQVVCSLICCCWYACACKVWVRDLWLLMLTFYFTTWLTEWTILRAVAENSWMQPACGQIMAKPMKSRRGLCKFTACTDAFLVWDVSTSFWMPCSNKAKN